MSLASNFEDLTIWQNARQLLKEIYSIFMINGLTQIDYGFRDKFQRAALSAERLANKTDVVIMNVPLRNHGIAGAMEFEIAISINGSYESTGHRAKLFGRLIDEHEVISSG